MVKLPIQANRWATLGKRRNFFAKIHIALGIGFIVVTFIHCKELAANLRQQKIEDLRSEVDKIATNETSKEEMLRVFGIKNR